MLIGITDWKNTFLYEHCILLKRFLGTFLSRNYKVYNTWASAHERHVVAESVILTIPISVCSNSHKYQMSSSVKSHRFV
jgi:hypothetical protein